jgi:hypothetical protein
MTALTRQRPDCIIIGAAKAGTTSLYNVLAGHPQVAPSREKETRFYSHDERYARGAEWYASEFFHDAAPDAVRMEATPAYLAWSDKVAPRIRRSRPDGRVSLVAVLRDPVARAYSHYCHRVRLGHEPRSFADAIAHEDELLRANWGELSRTGNGMHGYLRASCYASRLRPFVEQFEPGQILFLLQDDLRPAHFPQTMARLLAFLQVDEQVTLMPEQLNVPTRARHPGLARAYWRLKRTAARSVYTTLVPKAVRQAVLPLLFPAASYPPLDPALAQQLRVRLAGEVTATQDLIQRDLSHWLPA